MKLNDYLKLPPDVRSDVAFLVAQIGRMPKQTKTYTNVREVGNATFVVIPELLKKTPKEDLTRLINILFFGWKKLEKYVRLRWHVDDYGRIKYFTLPTSIVKAAREYNEVK